MRFLETRIESRDSTSVRDVEAQTENNDSAKTLEKNLAIKIPFTSRSR